MATEDRQDALEALAMIRARRMRALDRLRQLGLLHWTRRLVRDAASGWRCEQTSSAYVLTPERGTPAFACDLQTARAVKLVSSKKTAHEVPRAAPEARQAALEALAMVAARRMRALGLA